MSPVRFNRRHDTLEGTDNIADRDELKAPKQFSSSSGDQHNPRRRTSITHSSSSPLVLPYVKIESLGTAQQKHHSGDLRLTLVASKSPHVPSIKQQHFINSSHIHVAASEHPGREREEESPDDTKMRKHISQKTDTSGFGDNTEITTMSGSVILTPSGYVQASFTRSKAPAVTTHQLADNQTNLHNTPTSAPILPPGTSGTSDPEDDMQEYWKVSAPVSEPGSVLALLQAHSNTTSLSSDSVVADYTRTGRGTTSLSRAQTSVGYVQ